MSGEEQLNSALNLMRRMPPSSIENSLAGLIELVPSLTDELLNHIDQPLKIRRDPLKNQDYILCDYNRDGDSYRSPWSNSYYPPLEDGFLPDTRLRTMEIEANKLFDIYRRQYFEGGYSSVYYFDTEEKNASSSFGACFLIHKDIIQEKGLEKGWWDSIHVFEVNAEKNKTFLYKLTTTVMVSLALSSASTSAAAALVSSTSGSSSSASSSTASSNVKLGDVDISGSMTKQDERRLTVEDKLSSNPDATHLSNLGVMLEEMELRIRNAIENIYIQKTRDVVNGMRSTSGAREKAWEQLTSSLNQAVHKRHE